MSSEGSEEMKDERVDGELCAEHVRVDYMLFSVFFIFFNFCGRHASSLLVITMCHSLRRPFFQAPGIVFPCGR